MARLTSSAVTFSWMCSMRGNTGSGSPSQQIRHIITAAKTNFNIIHINARSVAAHICEMREILEGSDIHFCMVSETWLSSHSPPGVYQIRGYNFFRNDRVGNCGGVGIYCKKSFKVKTVLASEPRSPIEFLFLEVLLAESKVLIGSMYNPLLRITKSIPLRKFSQSLSFAMILCFLQGISTLIC